MLQKLMLDEKKFEIQRPKRKLCEIKYVPDNEITDALNRDLFQIIL